MQAYTANRMTQMVRLLTVVAEAAPIFVDLATMAGGPHWSLRDVGCIRDCQHPTCNPAAFTLRMYVMCTQMSGGEVNCHSDDKVAIHIPCSIRNTMC